MAIVTEESPLFPTATQRDPFQAISSASPPSKGFSLAVHVIPSGLVHIVTELSALYPTAIQREPFQATPFPNPPSKGFALVVHIIASGLVAIVIVAS